MTEYKVFLANFRQAARHLSEVENNSALASLEIGERQFLRWLKGQIGGLPRPASQRILKHLFGRSAEELFAPTPGGSSPTGHDVVAASASPRPAGNPEDTWTMLMTAADESARFAHLAEQTNVGPHTLEQMASDVTRIVTTYPNRPVVPLFWEAKALRDRSFTLLEGRQPPSMTSELYLLAGTLCGVLSNASFDLGVYHAAETHARTALLCAERAGHHALQTWIRGMQALIAYWDNRPAEAVRFVRLGSDLIPEGGTAAIRLASIEARALARLGRRELAVAAIRRARDLRQDFDGEELLGGLMAFPEAKEKFYASTAYLWLGEESDIAEAGNCAEEAVGMYVSLPAHEQRLGELSLARMDLALADLGGGELEGAADQVDHVLAVAARRPTESVTRRLGQFARRLELSDAGRSPGGIALLDAIQGSTRPPELPAGDME
ncbi:hypothetical protein ACPC54_19220 [Kitasatospora sp. NPDC094028]